MKNYFISAALAITLVTSCKEKKGSEEKEDKPISVLSIIKGQLNHLDTSLYQITKYETVGNKTDTAYVKREEMMKLAAPFLSLPEIADKEYYNKYTEDRLIDAQQQTLNITSTLKDNVEAEIQKQIVIIDIADVSDGKIRSIFIDRYITSGDSSIQQKLLWEIDNYFSIGTITEKENQPDKTNYIKIVWE